MYYTEVAAANIWENLYRIPTKHKISNKLRVIDEFNARYKRMFNNTRH